MEKIFDGKTEQEAVEAAIREFGVNSEHIDVEVLQKSKAGLFGKQGKVVIKATVIGLPSHHDDGDNHHYDNNKPQSSYSERVVIVDDAPKAEVSEEHQTEICAIVENLIEQMGMEAQCSLGIEDNFYMITVNIEEDEDQNLLIGRHGKNIEALQNIVNSIIQNQVDGFTDHVVIDIERYRKKRTEWLSSIARKKSHQVLQTGQSYTLDELGPFDRKLIHTVVREFDGVSTISKGNGYYKRVKIFVASDEREYEEDDSYNRMPHSAH